VCAGGGRGRGCGRVTVGVCGAAVAGGAVAAAAVAAVVAAADAVAAAAAAAALVVLAEAETSICAIRLPPTQVIFQSLA